MKPCSPTIIKIIKINDFYTLILYSAFVMYDQIKVDHYTLKY